MKYLGSSFTVAMGGDAYGEGWERIFGKKNECSCSHGVSLCAECESCAAGLCAECGSEVPCARHPKLPRPQSHDTPDFSPEPNPKCKHCGRRRSEHHEVETLGGPNLCCLKVEGTLASHEMLVLSERYWFEPETA